MATFSAEKMFTNCNSSVSRQQPTLMCICALPSLVSPTVGRGSSVGIATRYGLDGPGIESWWEQDFPHPSRPALGPTQPPTQWVLGLSRGQSGRGVALTTNTYLAQKLKSRAFPLLHLWFFVACYRVTFTFTLVPLPCHSAVLLA